MLPRLRDGLLALPKVTIDPALPTELSADLTALGMPLAFDARQADFTGVGVPPDPEQRLAPPARHVGALPRRDAPARAGSRARSA